MTVSRHSPHQINGEFLHTVRKGFAALGPTAPESVRSLRSRAIQQALLNTTWGDRSHGRIGRAWQGLLSAAWRAPNLLAAPRFHASLARLAVLTVVGHRRYEQLSQFTRRRKPSTLSLVPGA
jgi:hypothetical protein